LLTCGHASAVAGQRRNTNNNNGGASSSSPVCTSKDDSKCWKNQEGRAGASSSGEEDEEEPPPPCGVYMTPSWMDPVDNVVHLYAGVDLKKGSPVLSDPDPLISMIDPNKNEFSEWQNYFWRSDLVNGAHLDNYYYTDVFAPGLTSLAVCAPEREVNVVPNSSSYEVDAGGDVHRSRDPTAGSFEYRYGSIFRVSKPAIRAGQEIYASCSTGNTAFDPRMDDDTKDAREPKSIEWLEENAFCVDTMAVKKSNIPRVGRGAFSKRRVETGQVVAVSPVIVLDRSQLQVVEQRINKATKPVPNLRDDHDIEYSHNVTGHQVVLNYCFGKKESNVLLLPLAPGVHAINHASSSSANGDDDVVANAYVRWSAASRTSELLEMTTHELFDQVGEPDQLVLEIAALRDIEPGDEILLDYGRDWDGAWAEHVDRFRARAVSEEDKEYVSAAEYSRSHPDDSIRTAKEQKKKPYPSNVRTVCEFVPDEEAQRRIDQEEESLDDDDDEVDHYRPETLVLEWKNAYHAGCKRPCDVIERNDDGTYNVVVYDREGSTVGVEYCGELSDKGVRIAGMPASAISLADRPYTSDMFLPGAFRHEIGIPQDLFPPNWDVKDRRSNGDFIPTPLRPGELSKIRWADTGEVVTPNAYRLGLAKGIRQTLLEYCHKMGITEAFRHVTSHGNALEPGAETYLTLDGEQWYMQRPEAKWASNLQWLSPGTFFFV